MAPLAKTDPAFAETNRYEPNSPYSRQQGGQRPPGARLPPHLRPAGARPPTAATTTGPFHFPEKLIPLMIVNAQAGKPLPVYGDGQQIRDWLYVQRPLQRHPPCAGSRRLGRNLQRRRLERKAQPRHRAHRVRPAG